MIFNTLYIRRCVKGTSFSELEAIFLGGDSQTKLLVGGLRFVGL